MGFSYSKNHEIFSNWVFFKTEKNQLVYLQPPRKSWPFPNAAHWYILNILAIIMSSTAVWYGCHLSQQAYDDGDDESEWPYRYVTFVILIFTELPLLFFIQYFFVERMQLASDGVNVYFIINIVVTFITLCMFMEQIFTIIQPLVRNWRNTVISDLVIIISTLLMFIGVSQNVRQSISRRCRKRGNYDSGHLNRDG